MNGIDLSIKVLIESPSERALDALLDGMANEPMPPVRAKLFDCLLSGKWDVAAEKMIAHYSRLDSAQKSKILERQDSLISHLRGVLAHGTYDAKCNAIQIIADIGKTKLLHMLVPVFSGIDERLRRKAGEALLRMVLNHAEMTARLQPGDTSPLAAAAERSRNEILAVFTELHRSYNNHREQNVLRAMLAFGGECRPMLLSTFEIGSERAAADLSRVLIGATTEHWHPLVALMYLSRDESVRRKADFVMKKRGPAALPPVLHDIFLAGEPRDIATLADWWGTDTWWKVVAEHADSFEAPAQAKLLAVATLPRSDGDKLLPCLEKLSHSASAHIRRQALAEITARTSAEMESLKDFLEDPDEEVQLQSTRTVISSDDPLREELVIRQLLSQYESVRKVAAEEVSRFSFRAYMRAFDSLGDRTRLLAASALTKINGDLEKNLAEALAAEGIDTKIRALKIIALAAPEEGLEPAVIALADDPNPYIRATAVMALSAFASKATELAVIKALKDPDGRVVANAIEALEFRGSATAKMLVKEFAASRTARVRANAVKFLYRSGDETYREAFLDMCEHGDNRMRASAKWLAEHLSMPEAAEGLARIASRQTELRTGRRRDKRSSGNEPGADALDEKPREKT
jgi:HEAT repeat protein